MKSKIEMAHDYAMQCIISSTVSLRTNQDIIDPAWGYADKMQAEADKREEDKAIKEAENHKKFMDELNQKNQNHHDELVSIGLEDWQPDWSQAPDGYNWWAFDGFSKKANWYNSKPYIDDEAEGNDEWNIESQADTKVFLQAPSFGYQGDWKDSLRKRP